MDLRWTVPARMPLYLPGNGALLAAIALMDGGPERRAPGFPDDSTSVAQVEGLLPPP